MQNDQQKQVLRELRQIPGVGPSIANDLWQLGIRSILAAPVCYERDIVGLVEVFRSTAFAFDDGDLAVVERLAQTVVLTLSRAEVFQEK